MLFSSCSKDTTDEFEHFFFRTDGADLSVEVNGNVGSKVFVVYLHGGPGGGSYAYNLGFFSDEMEKDYAMVYVDQRGNGASQGEYDKEELTLAQNSKDIFHLCEFLREKYGDDISMFLAGHSWGGITSAHALITTDLQKDMKGWIEMNGAHDFDKLYIDAVKMFKVFGEEEIANGNNTDFWQTTLDRVNEIDTLNITSADSGFLNSTAFEAEGKFDFIESETAGSLPYLLGAPGLSLASYMSNLFGNPILNEDSGKNSLTERLNEIEIPSLFLWGKYDFVVPPSLGLDAFDRVGTSEKEIIIYESSGHSPMSNEPEAFTADVKMFIEKYK